MKLTEKEMGFLIKAIIKHYENDIFSDYDFDEKLISMIIKETEIVEKSVVEKYYN